jgi:hypothetical protein
MSPISEVPPGSAAEPCSTPYLDVAVPVYNEEAQLAGSIAALREYLDHAIPFRTLITIVDNASIDSTPRIASGLAAAVPGVRAIRLDEKGRGRALRAAWSSSPAAIVAYMDVDLSTRLDALLPLVTPIASGHSDICVGSRLAPGACVVRSARREVISRAYNLLVRTALSSSIRDAQCGFKALRRDVALELLPLIADNEWFFDTELLVTAQRRGLRVHEVPVDWIEDPDSRVALMSTAFADLWGIVRLRRLPSQARRIGADRRGVPATSAYLWRLAGSGPWAVAGSVTAFLLTEPLIGALPAAWCAGLLCGSVALGVNRDARRQASRAPRGALLSTAAVVVGVAPLLNAAVPAVLYVGGIRGWAVEAVGVAVGAEFASLSRFAALRTWLWPPNLRGPSTRETRAVDHDERDVDMVRAVPR